MTVHRGMTLVDVVVGSALFLVIFLGLFGLLKASLDVAGLARAKAAATSLASSQMEYIRSLDYDAIGTVGGIPAGAIAQSTTTTQGGLPFSVRTYIAYVDDAKDGIGVADHNAVTTDYKVVKVTISYEIDGVEREVILVTNMVPPGIETTTGGGTIRVDIVDAQGLGVPGATVRIQNSAVSPAIDLSTFSDATGVILLGGAPTSTEYQIAVSKTGYSSAQTYERDATNQNPNPGYLTVAEGQTTSGTFAIDLLAELVLRTFSPIQDGMFSDSFDDATALEETTNTTVDVGALVLSGAPGSYALSGTALASSTAPGYLASWVSASASYSEPGGTSVRVHVADGTGTLLSDVVLPGNSTGFSGVIDLSGIATTTYPALSLYAALTTADALTTPSVSSWELNYTEGPLPLPDVPFTVTGGKTTGSTGIGDPIYKTIVATTTDMTGARTLSLEWDAYSLSLPGYTVEAEDPEPPYELLPGSTVEGTLILTPL